MRRIFSLLVIACFLWPQAWVLLCPSGSMPMATEAAVHSHHASDASHGPASDSADPAPSSHHHEGPGCKMVMTCGVVALPSIVSSVPAGVGLFGGAIAVAVQTPESLHPASDPPPPRLLV